MSAFKVISALLIISCLVAVQAHNGDSCDHGKNDKSVFHYYRSTLEDLDLAAGRSPFTGQSVTRKTTIITMPDGTRKVVTEETSGDGEGNDLGEFGGFDDFKRFFESGPGGHRFRGSEDPFGTSFGGRPSAAPAGRPSAAPAGRPSAAPAGKPAAAPMGDEDLDELLRKLAGGELGRIPDAPKQPINKPTRPIPDAEPVHAPKVDTGRPNDLEDIEEILRKLQGGKGGKSPASNEPLKMTDANGSEFRIVLDFSTLTVGTPQQHAYIQKRLMPVVVDYFKAALKLKYPLKDKITIPAYQDDCDGPIPEKYRKEGVEGDLLIFIRTMDEKYDGAVAQAMTCSRDSRSGRSISSSIKFNLGHVNTDDKDPLVHQKNVYTTTHELTHVLGFTSQHFQSFLNADGTRNRNALIQTDTNLLVNVEPLTSKLRKYFNCDKLQGAPLENQGGSGSANSHFERKLFFNEFMTASEIHDGRISEFTLALLEGSGWYVVDYSRAEPFTVGQGQGCDYVMGKCIVNGAAAFDEFCVNQGETMCSANYNSMAQCQPDPFSDNCGLPHTQSNMDCRNVETENMAQVLPEMQKFGPNENSKCFMGNLTPSRYSIRGKTAYCFTYKCNGSGATTTVDINIGKATAKCTKKESVSVPGFTGMIDCPDPLAFCKIVDTPYCPRGCSGRGTCHENKCQCNSGFKGFDCADSA